jgi:Replication initiator protein A (RepA) N-terminus.
MKLINLNSPDVAKFIKVPAALLKNKKYSGMRSETKLMYGLLQNRTKLSMLNGWYTSDGFIYVIFTIKALSNELGYGRDKIMNMLSELEKYELIVRKKQGFSKPDIIFVAELEPFDYMEEMKSEIPTYEVGNSDHVKSEIPTYEVDKSDLIKKENKKKENKKKEIKEREKKKSETAKADSEIADAILDSKNEILKDNFPSILLAENKENDFSISESENSVPHISESFRTEHKENGVRPLSSQIDKQLIEKPNKRQANKTKKVKELGEIQLISNTILTEQKATLKVQELIQTYLEIRKSKQLKPIQWKMILEKFFQDYKMESEQVSQIEKAIMSGWQALSYGRNENNGNVFNKKVDDFECKREETFQTDEEIQADLEKTLKFFGVEKK